MNIDNIFELRKERKIVEAYEAARAIYAVEKGHRASVAMFWAAVDMLKALVNEDHIEEASKILLALERLLNNVEDEKGWMHNAFQNCNVLLEKGKKREDLSENGPKHIKMGTWGEELATAYLREKGYVILERDWRSKHRDIDIIAQDGDCTVFVEVKTRSNCDFADPLESINYKKQKNLCRAINHYIHYRKLDNRCRFDVITIVGELGCKMPEINHIEDFALNCW